MRDYPVAVRTVMTALHEVKQSAQVARGVKLLQLCIKETIG